MIRTGLILAFGVIAAQGALAGNLSGCTYKGIPLYGKVKVVTSFPDIKVKVVKSFPDLKVKRVSAFPNQCGQWQFVDAFADFKVQFVESFADIKIQYVDAFPGVR
ncbi:MAG: hypothetical protein J6V64_04440 [Burkholderiaceae bacterium]|nr:hypothetical protein [Burkholderiaceae bacterium]